MRTPGRSSKVNVLVISASVTVIIRQCPCTACERHLAFFVCLFFSEERSALALWQGARLHGCREPPEGSDLPGSLTLVICGSVVVNYPG